MNQNATAGTNLTGLVAAPQRSQEMLTGMEEFPPSSEGSAEDLALVRIAYAKEAEPLGSVPLLVHAKGKGKSAAKAVKGRTAAALHGQARRTAGVRTHRHAPL